MDQGGAVRGAASPPSALGSALAGPPSARRATPRNPGIKSSHNEASTAQSLRKARRPRF